MIFVLFQLKVYKKNHVYFCFIILLEFLFDIFILYIHIKIHIYLYVLNHICIYRMSIHIKIFMLDYFQSNDDLMIL